MAITIWFWFCSALKPPWHNYCFRDQFVSDCAMMRCAWLRIRGRGGLLRKLWCATWGLAGLGGLRIPPRPTWSHTWRHWVLLAEIWALGLCFFLANLLSETMILSTRLARFYLSQADPPGTGWNHTEVLSVWRPEPLKDEKIPGDNGVRPLNFIQPETLE